MNIAICDDSKEDTLYLTALLKGHKFDVFSAPDSLLQKIEQAGNSYDLYLLDIYMGEAAEGIDLAKDIRKIDNDASICFISSSDEFYREAYDLQDVNYLLKPVTEESFKSLIERTERRQIKNRGQSFRYKWNGQMEAIPYRKITYINSNDHILDIHLNDGSIRHCSLKLDDVETLLDSNMFFRCHQSFIVNLYCVDRLTGTDFVLGEKLISISRRYLPNAKQRYREVLFEEVT